jgi:putative transcriptional regulator
MLATSQTSSEVVSARIKVERNSKGLSQAKLAEMAGIDRKTVNRIENGHFSPTLETLIALGDALGVSPHLLLSR